MVSLRSSLATLACLAFVGFAAARADDPSDEVIKDRKGYLPQRKHVEVPGKIIGILLADGQPILSTEGRSGPADQLVFSEGGNSYRWVYVPTFEKPQITNLQVPVGPKGEINIFPALNMANPKSVIPWGVTQPYTLVEVTVNTEKGSPPNDSFVGTSFKVVEGSREFPLKAHEAIALVKKAYAEYQKTNEKMLDDAMAKTQLKALKDKKTTGPREKQELMYVTWLGKEELLEVRFRTKLADGAYTFVEGGGIGPFDPRDPPPLPPIKGRPVPPAPPEKGPILNGGPAVPPPPPRFKVRIGTGFGIEYGRAYQVDKSGKLVRTLTLPVEDFVTEERSLPPGVLPPGRDRPLPLPPGGGPNPFLRD